MLHILYVHVFTSILSSNHCMYYAIMFYLCVQVNAVLLTISLGSLAKSQLGKTTSEMTPEKNERRKQYMEVGK